MIILVALCFIMCWTPFYLVTLISQLQTDSFLRQANFVFTMLLTHLVGFTGSCINPIIYHLMSDRFRKSFKQIWCGILCWCICRWRQKRRQGDESLFEGVSSSYGDVIGSEGSESSPHTIAMRHFRGTSFQSSLLLRSTVRRKSRGAFSHTANITKNGQRKNKSRPKNNSQYVNCSFQRLATAPPEGEPEFTATSSSEKRCGKEGNQAVNNKKSQISIGNTDNPRTKRAYQCTRRPHVNYVVINQTMVPLTVRCSTDDALGSRWRAEQGNCIVNTGSQESLSSQPEEETCDDNDVSIWEHKPTKASCESLVSKFALIEVNSTPVETSSVPIEATYNTAGIWACNGPCPPINTLADATNNLCLSLVDDNCHPDLPQPCLSTSNGRMLEEKEKGNVRL